MSGHDHGIDVHECEECGADLEEKAYEVTIYAGNRSTWRAWFCSPECASRYQTSVDDHLIDAGMEW